MEIKESWFYDLSKIKDKKIKINTWLKVYFYDNWIFDREVIILDKVELKYYSIVDLESTRNISFFQNGKWWSLDVSILLLSLNKQKINYNIGTIISNSNLKTDVKILSIVWDDWYINLDWIIEIKEKLSSLDSNLEEENIFLSDSWIILASPQLLVKSNDVKAKHSCKIEKLSEQKKFYIKSRWLSDKEAESLLVYWKIKNLFKFESEEIEKNYLKLTKRINTFFH